MFNIMKRKTDIQQRNQVSSDGKASKTIFILTIMSLFVAVSMVYSLFFTPKSYESITKLNIVEKSNTSDQLSAEEYKDIILSDETLLEVKDSTNLGFSLEALRKKIDVDVSNGIRVIDVKVNDISKDKSNKLSSAFAMAAVENLGSNSNVEEVKISKETKTKLNTSKMNFERNAAIAAVAGLVIGAIMSLFIGGFSRKIKTREDIENKLGIRVLEAIPAYNDRR